jgi:hypothetical protein
LAQGGTSGVPGTSRIPSPLDQFIRRKGGINACVGRFSRCLGRWAAG